MTIVGRKLAKYLDMACLFTGILKDSVGSYEGSFYMSGAVGVLACSLFISLLYYQRYTQRKAKIAQLNGGGV